MNDLQGDLQQLQQEVDLQVLLQLEALGGWLHVKWNNNANTVLTQMVLFV